MIIYGFREKNLSILFAGVLFAAMLWKYPGT